MERRQDKRWLMRCPVEIVCPHELLSGLTSDISLQGMGVSLQKKLDLAYEYPIKILLPVGEQRLSGMLLWTKSEGEEEIQAGIHLYSVSAEYVNFLATIKYNLH